MHLKPIFSIAIAILISVYSCKENSNPSNAEEKEVPVSTEQEQDAPVSEATETETESNTKTDSITAAPLKYICFTSDTDKSKRIWIALDKNERAQKVKYEGQAEAMALKHTKEDYQEGGVHPTIINYYDEIYDGKVNGSYKLTHSGNWDYVTYTRGKDGKVFKFTIDHNANPYGSTPCF